MVFVDGSVVNVALPVLQQDLQATITQVQWVVEAYVLFLASLLLVGGSLSDRLGRRRSFAIGITLFTLASLACGFAPDVQTLIIARAGQGIGGALLVPNSLALIRATFSDEQRGPAVGTWSSGIAISSALGLVLGGWIVEHGSWRWVFFLNGPLSLVVLSVLFWRVPPTPASPSVGKLDWPGAVLVTLGLGSLVYGLLEAPHVGFQHPIVFCALGMSVVCLAGFVLVEKYSLAPMLPLSLFQSRTFRGVNLLTLLLYAALGGMFFFLPFTLIQVHGYSATQAGAAFLPMSAIMFTGSRWAGGLVTRYGARRPLMIGPCLAACGYGLFAWLGLGSHYWTNFFPGILVMATGMMITVAPLTTTVLGAVAEQHAGLASGLNSAISRAASLLAIALLGIVAVSVFNSQLDQHLEALEIPHDVRRLIDAERSKLAAAEVPASISDHLRPSLEQAIADSFAMSFRWVMCIASGLALLSAGSVWWMVEDTE
jgi:EmrB/QacA subfamily drug resistance transporter